MTKDIKQRLLFAGKAYRHISSQKILIFLSFDEVSDSVALKTLREETFYFTLLEFYTEFEPYQEQLYNQ